MLSLERSLTDRLRRQRVRIDVPDANTAWFRNVPANQRFFNKPTTSLLVKRQDAGQPFVVCVDEDLQYEGADAGIAQAFAKGRREQGWRVLFVDAGADGDLQPVVERALDALGFEGLEPRMEPSAPVARSAGRKDLVGSFGVDLTAAVDDGSAEPSVGRSDAIDAVCAALFRQRPLLPVITGESGAGKTNLLHGTARRLRDLRPGLRLVSVDLGVMLAGTLFGAERETLLASVLKEAGAPDLVLALEHIELARAQAPHSITLLSEAIDRGARLVGTAFAASVVHLDVPPLGRRLLAIDLPELPLAAMSAVLAGHRARIAQHHGVAIDEAFLDLALDAACSVEGLFPTKALALVDASASAAALAGRPAVNADDLYAVMRLRTHR